MPGRKRPPTWLWPLLAAALASCAGDETRPGALPAGTPIVLISVDTLRSDRLPAYGYGAVRTPALDELRGDSILFESAYCHVPLTLPSHASLLTGLLPPEHGVRSNVGYRLEAGDRPSLPRLLREAGYATGAAVSSYVLRGATGMAASFDLYDAEIDVKPRSSLGHLQRSGEETLAAILPWLRSMASEQERPFFLFLHLYEPHSPYEPPEPFRSRYPHPYDGEVAEADRVVGLLMSELQGLGLYDKSLVFFLSDHGEGLGEHGQPHHEVFVYRESLQVPLLVKLPHGERAGESVRRPVQLIDVLPTVYEALGQTPPDDLRGSSLLGAGAEDDERAIYAESLYPLLHFGWSGLTSLIRGRHHYIEAPTPELYDLDQDPEELRDVRQRERRLAARMSRDLEAYDEPFKAPEAIDPTTRDKLAALGYVGVPAEDGVGEERPDPKTRLAVLRPLALAFRHFFEGDFEAAAREFQEIVAREPQLVDAWDHLGKSLYYLGRQEESLAAYRRALELSGGAPNVALSAAEAHLAVGDLEAARRHAELAAPTHESAWDVLAQVALRQGDLAAAERHVERALSLRGTRLRPLILEAELRLHQGRFEESLELTRQAEALAPGDSQPERLSGLYLVRGQVLGHLGEVESAKRAFLREIEISPRLLEAYAHLAYLHALAGDGESAGRVLRHLVEANRTPAAYVTVVKTLEAMRDPRSAAAARKQALELWPESRELLELDPL